MKQSQYFHVRLQDILTFPCLPRPRRKQSKEFERTLANTSEVSSVDESMQTMSIPIKPHTYQVAGTYHETCMSSATMVEKEVLSELQK